MHNTSVPINQAEIFPGRARLAGWSRHRDRKVVGAILGFVLALAAGAIAAWFTSGTGPGKGSIASLGSLTVTAAATPGAACLPGESCELALSVENPSTAPLEIYRATFTGGVSVTGHIGPSDCGASNFTLDGTMKTLATPIALPAGTATATKLPKSLNLVVLNSNAPTDCQGGTITATGIKLDARTL